MCESRIKAAEAKKVSQRILFAASFPKNSCIKLKPKRYPTANPSEEVIFNPKSVICFITNRFMQIAKSGKSELSASLPNLKAKRIRELVIEI
jgi:hypothetical protein